MRDALTIPPPPEPRRPGADGSARGGPRAPDPAPGREALAVGGAVTFHNPENGFCVLRVKVRGQRSW